MTIPTLRTKVPPLPVCTSSTIVAHSLSELFPAVSVPFHILPPCLRSFQAHLLGTPELQPRRSCSRAGAAATPELQPRRSCSHAGSAATPELQPRRSCSRAAMRSPERSKHGGSPIAASAAARRDSDHTELADPEVGHFGLHRRRPSISPHTTIGHGVLSTCRRALCTCRLSAVGGGG